MVLSSKKVSSKHETCTCGSSFVRSDQYFENFTEASFRHKSSTTLSIQLSHNFLNKFFISFDPPSS